MLRIALTSLIAATALLLATTPGHDARASDVGAVVAGPGLGGGYGDDLDPTAGPGAGGGYGDDLDPTAGAGG